MKSHGILFCFLSAIVVMALSRAALGHEDQSLFELGPSFSASWNDDGKGRMGDLRLPVRYFVFSGANLGVEARYWPSGSYPLSQGTGGVVATGANGQIYFVNQSRLGAYVGGALLWAPAHTQLILSPEVGVRYFITQKIAIGASYEIVTDLGSFLLSIEPTPTSGSTQSAGLSLAFEL